ncbi:MAG TPA: hypothetical protein VFQ80_14530, partial [Thermomicrobiales bacterium]|nr:hypothetical protein [Thermomicrobiales bacterium]
QPAGGGVASVGSQLRLADGATIEALAEGLLPAGSWAGGDAVVTVTRATLPPGAALAPHPVAGEQLLAVEAGLLGVAVPAIGEDSADPAGEVLIRDGYPLARGTAPRLRNAGGTRLDLLVVTLEPPASSGAAVVASPGATATDAG